MVSPNGLVEHWIEICACGHPVSKHVLVGTEYCRCEAFPTDCPCAGGARIAVLAQEGSLPVKVGTSSARFFKRRFRTDGPHPLNGAIEKSRAEGISMEWAVSECDICGEGLPDVDGHLSAYWTDSEGEPIVGEMHVVTGRTLLVCGLCEVELEWKNGLS